LHAKANEAQRQAWLDQHRPSPSVRGYDLAWRELRGLHLAMSPLCVQCGKQATDVDHINPISSYPALRLAPSNLRSLCHACHSARTARDQGFARRAQSVTR
jgi:5-methylcytosine-specific restriction protein A